MLFIDFKNMFFGNAASKKWTAIGLKFLISGFLIWYLLLNIDIGSALDRLVDVETDLLVGAMAIIFLQVIICGLRWEAVLAVIGKPLGFLKAFQLALIGSFFNQTLPSAVGGDAVRIYKAYRHGLGIRGAVNGVVLERTVTVVSLVMLVVFVQPWFLPRLSDEMIKVVLPGLFLFTVAAIVGLVFLMLLDRLPTTLQRWRLVRGLGDLGIDARSLFFSWHLPRSMVWGFLSHINLSFGVFLLAIGLAIDVSWFECLVLMPLVILVMTVPISIAGWGVREAAMVTFFGLIGTPPEEAVVLSILFGLTTMAMALPGGIIWLATRDNNEKIELRTPNLKTSEQSAEIESAYRNRSKVQKNPSYD